MSYRIRENFLRGHLGSSLTDSGTTLTADILLEFPTVQDGDVMAVVIDPAGYDGDPEIVWITAHTGGATPADTATIERGKEGTVARAHDAGVTIIHAPTTADFSRANQISSPLTGNPYTEAPVFEADFTDGSLSSSTGLTVSGTCNWVEGLGVLSAEFGDQTAQDVAARIWDLPGTPSHPMVIETAVSFGNFGGGDCFAFLGFTDGVTASDDTVAVEHRSGVSAATSAFGIRGGTFTAFAASSGSIVNGVYNNNLPVRMRLEWDGANNWVPWFSTDHVTWMDIEISSSPFSHTLTPTKFYVGVSSHGSSGVSRRSVTFHYLRAYDVAASSLVLRS